ncbi:hypothetical protein FRC01_008877, partial [Tulasnella sp. 417]
TIAPYADPFDVDPRSVQEQDSEQEEASEEERNAVEFEVSRFQEEPNEDELSEPDRERERQLEQEHEHRQEQVREHRVETWLAIAWEEKPLTKERRIEKLPNEYRIKWKKHYANHSTITDELRETFGNDYKARMEEGAIARLTAAAPERPLLPEDQLQDRMGPQYADQGTELCVQKPESQLPSIVGSRSS